MIPSWLPLALSALLFAPELLHAQTRIVDAKLVFEMVADNDKMYEDIEILRRILDRKLHSHYVRHQYQSTGKSNLNAWFTTQGVIDYPQTPYLLMQPNNLVTIWRQQPAELWTYNNLGQGNPAWVNNWYQAPIAWQEVVTTTLEGVYLKGQGVIYTATLSSLQPTAKAETAKKPVSEWESVRRQVRNEKEVPKKAEANKPLPLSDVLLKLLAENGHYFSQLGENERLTIVLTVHDTSPSSSPAKSAGKSAKTESKPATSNGTSHQSQVRDLELLGDLHLKQGQYEEAIKAFQKAVDHKNLEPKVSEALYRKLAQCYLAVDKMEDARSALEKAVAIRKNAQEAAGPKNQPANPAKPSAAALPVKLIISAPKKLLDEVKEAKISFEEFRRRAHVETLRFDSRR